MSTPISIFNIPPRPIRFTVFYFYQTQSTGRGQSLNLTRRSGEEILNQRRASRGFGNVDLSLHDPADHVIQEGICRYFKVQLIPRSLPAGFKNPSDGLATRSGRPPKSSKIVAAHELVSTLLQNGHVKPRPDPPAVPLSQWCPLRVNQDTVAIPTDPGVKTGMEIRRGRFNRPHGYGRRQIGIERILQRFERVIPGVVKSNDLAVGVDAGIGSTRCRNACACPANPGQGRFDLSLDGSPVGLALEAEKFSSIVSQDDFVTFHTWRQIAKKLFDQLQEHHFSRIAVAWAKLDQTGVAAVALFIARGNLVEQALDRYFVLQSR